MPKLKPDDHGGEPDNNIVRGERLYILRSKLKSR